MDWKLWGTFLTILVLNYCIYRELTEMNCDSDLLLSLKESFFFSQCILTMMCALFTNGMSNKNCFQLCWKINNEKFEEGCDVFCLFLLHNQNKGSKSHFYSRSDFSYCQLETLHCHMMMTVKLCRRTFNRAQFLNY